MPEIRFLGEDGSEYKVPSENISALKRAHPNIKILGLARQSLEQFKRENEPRLPGQQSVEKFVRSRAFLPMAGAAAAGLATGGMGLAPALAMEALGAGAGEAANQFIATAKGNREQSSGAAAKKIAGQALAGGLGGAAGRTVMGGMRAMGPELRRIVPAWLRTVAGLAQESGEQLAKDPQGIAKISKQDAGSIMADVAKTVKGGMDKFKHVLTQSNKKYQGLKLGIEKMFSNSKFIPSGKALADGMAKAEELALGEGTLDPKSRMAVTRLFRSIQSKAGPDGKLTFSDFNNIRVGINNISNQLSSNQAKAVYSAVKEGLDQSLDSVVPGKIGSAFSKILDEQSTLRAFGDDILPFLGQKNAGLRVAQEIETSKSISSKLGKTIADRLKEFEEAIGGGFLEPIQKHVRSLPFAENIVQNLPAGSTGAIGLKSGMSLGMVPYVGRLFSPRSIANFAAGVSRLPQRQLPYTRAGVQGFFGDQSK